MRVLIDHHDPFLLAHGGFQVQITQTLAALRDQAITAAPLAWWDPASEPPDVIHFFGIPPIHYVRRARAKQIGLVVTHLLTNTCNRSRPALRLQSTLTRMISRSPIGQTLSDRLGWSSLREADAVVVGLRSEEEIVAEVWSVDRDRVWQVPLGVGAEFFWSDRPSLAHRVRQGKYLIAVGTICARKHSVSLADLANRAQVPLVFVGKPLAESDPEWESFRTLAASEWVTHVPHVDNPAELAGLYRGAAGFVHFSEGENWCLAAHEARACGLPLLLRDQPWSRERFSEQATFWRNPDPEVLGKFFQAALPAPVPEGARPPGWGETARELIRIYENVISRKAAA
jgi:glycosyltransferase involved in cell wall biosynthesis